MLIAKSQVRLLVGEPAEKFRQRAKHRMRFATTATTWLESNPDYRSSCLAGLAIDARENAASSFPIALKNQKLNVRTGYLREQLAEEFHRPGRLAESDHESFFIQKLAGYSDKKSRLPVFAGKRREKIVFSLNIVDIQDAQEIFQHLHAASEMNLHASTVLGWLYLHEMAVKTAGRKINPRESARNICVTHPNQAGCRDWMRQTFDRCRLA